MPNRKQPSRFQKVVQGLQIFERYLSLANPGDVAAEHDEIFVTGVDLEVLGGDDREKLEALGWEWNESLGAWGRTL